MNRTTLVSEAKELTWPAVPGVWRPGGASWLFAIVTDGAYQASVLRMAPGFYPPTLSIFELQLN